MHQIYSLLIKYQYLIDKNVIVMFTVISDITGRQILKFIECWFSLIFLRLFFFFSTLSVIYPLVYLGYLSGSGMLSIGFPWVMQFFSCTYCNHWLGFYFLAILFFTPDDSISLLSSQEDTHSQKKKKKKLKSKTKRREN